MTLTFIIKSQPPLSLMVLDVFKCKKLEGVFKDEVAENGSMSLLNSPSISTSFSRGQFPAANLCLKTHFLLQLTGMYSSGQLLEGLRTLLVITVRW